MNTDLKLDGPKIVPMGDFELIFEDQGDPGEWFKEKARKELRETPELRDESLEAFKKLISAREDISSVGLWDDYLMSYLRSCKFYPESAMQKLLKAFSFRQKYSKYCCNLRPSKEKSAFTQNVFTVLPLRDQHGRRILLIECGRKWNPKEVSLVEFIRGIMMIIEAALLEPKTQISGATLIIDLDGLSLNHVWQFSPQIAKMLLDLVQEALPCRLKAVHIVNQPMIFNMLYSIFKPFIGEKLRNRIFFHGTNFSGLTEQIDPKSLPRQYGGDMKLDTVYGENLHRVMCQYEEKFEEVNQRGFVDKSKKSSKKN